LVGPGLDSNSPSPSPQQIVPPASPLPQQAGTKPKVGRASSLAASAEAKKPGFARGSKAAVSGAASQAPSALATTGAGKPMRASQAVGKTRSTFGGHPSQGTSAQRRAVSSTAASKQITGGSGARGSSLT